MHFRFSSEFFSFTPLLETVNHIVIIGSTEHMTEGDNGKMNIVKEKNYSLISNILYVYKGVAAHKLG